MRIAFSIPVQAFDSISEATAEIPMSIGGRLLTEQRLATWLDPEVADQGVVGGEVRLWTKEKDGPHLQIVYWLPTRPTDDLILRLRDDLLVQLDDGVGEGGFDVDLGGHTLNIRHISGAEVRWEVSDDGVVVPPIPKAAIAARDGQTGDLAHAIEADRSSVDRIHQGYTALGLAILYGHIDAVRMLLLAGADPNHVDAQASSPLTLAMLTRALNDEDSLSVATMLIEAGASMDSDPQREVLYSYAESRGKHKTAQLFSA